MTVNFGSHYLTVNNVNLEEWCVRYDLRTFIGKCRKCGSELPVIIPFFTKNRRGLCAKTCDCGNTSIPFTFIDFNYPSTGV